MEINITIFIQIINFWITYWILHKFFLKPMVAFIQQKECAFALVTETIKQKEKILEELQQEKTRELLTFKTHINISYQMTELPLEDRTIPTVDTSVSTNPTKNSVTECKNVILKKVCDVCSCSNM